ncbi:MAG: hypothetical protein Q9192_002068, partial [Flavoplaca navasiana]
MSQFHQARRYKKLATLTGGAPYAFSRATSTALAAYIPGAIPRAAEAGQFYSAREGEALTNYRQGRDGWRASPQQGRLGDARKEGKGRCSLRDIIVYYWELQDLEARELDSLAALLEKYGKDEGVELRR